MQQSNEQPASQAYGKLYMIPVPIAENALHTLPEAVKLQSCSFKFYFVENIRTARRHLKSIDKAVDIDAIEFSEINSQTPPDVNLLRKWLKSGHDVGVMSEAGCPGVADPGAVLAAAAQEIGATVVPLTGPSSILLALMASGFNGQGFRFAGYLPVKEPMRGKAIKELESISAERNETQIFIETPYRNNQLFQDVMRLCKHGTKLCIAASITDEREFIQTKTVAEWATQAPELHKKPVIFLLMA
jgi:16S rRNA (cytidine1402-2'-O)-methyltransferase